MPQREPADGDLTPTGIPELDMFLHGGLPAGFTTLVLAPPGSGVEIFAKQFACGRSQDRTVYVTTDESRREVQSAVAQAGWDATHVEVVDLQTEFAEAMMEAQGPEAGSGQAPRRFDPRELVEGTHSYDVLERWREGDGGTGGRDRDYLRRLVDPFSRLRHPDRMVVHSLDFFLNLYPPEKVVAVLTALKAANGRAGSQLMLVLSKGAHGAQLERRMELLSDCLVELEVTRKGTNFERFFLVKKVKNRSFGVGVSTYEVRREGFHLETLERIV